MTLAEFREATKDLPDTAQIWHTSDTAQVWSKLKTLEVRKEQRRYVENTSKEELPNFFSEQIEIRIS